MMLRLLTAVALGAALAGCATPYQEMGFTGGVQATQITGDTFQVTARGNAYTDADTIQRYALRKSAEQTLQRGYDLFLIGGAEDRTQFGTQSFATANSTGWGSAWGTGTSWQLVKPGQTLMVKMLRYPPPDPLPPGMFDAREVLSFLTPPPKVDQKDCAVGGSGKVVCQ